MASFDAVFSKLLSVAEKRALDVGKVAVKFTAIDVRRQAQRSIKSGGKNPRVKNWSVSKPGEPPKSHIGTLKKAIMYEAVNDSTYLIGPERVGASTTLKTLEYGGTGQFREVSYSANYVKKKRKRTRAKSYESASLRCRVHGTLRTTRPRATRPYYVYSRDLGRGVIVRDYRYFYSREEWEAARNSPLFQAWAKTVRSSVTTRVHVDARPYMRPALASQTTPEKNEARLRRAVKNVARQESLVGIPY